MATDKIELLATMLTLSDGRYPRPRAEYILQQLESVGWVLAPLEASEGMSNRGEYICSEHLNDNAPIGQAMYRTPARAVYNEMVKLQKLF